MNKTFVQIASYRDPQLVPTLRDMFTSAKYPERLSVGICWQHCENETLEEFENHPQVRYQDIDYKKSEGLGWARKKVSELYDGEKYTLQLDSHHRFARGWDAMMYQDYDQAGTLSNKPILTTYLTPFEVGYDCKCELNKTPSLMKQYEFSSDKLIMSMPHYITDYSERDTVIKTRLISGHFYFTDAKFITEVPYDPEIYFGGYCEETTMSIRAWTRGYDFFSPFRQYIWHEYTREGRPKHWDDHGISSETKKTSGERDAFARSKTRQIFRIEDNGIDISPIHDVGNQRTLEDWQKYSGINLNEYTISQYAFDAKEPPEPVADTIIQLNVSDSECIDCGFGISTSDESHNTPLPTPTNGLTVMWDVDFFKKQYNGKYKVITLGILDKFDKEYYRKDFDSSDILNYEINSFTINRQISSKHPLKVVMYGLTSNNEWTTRYEKTIRV